jgi:hypothetical protein
MFVPYTGNAAYCFTNSLHMCLQASSRDRGAVPEPGFLECLTGMTFGGHYSSKWVRYWPSAPNYSPEKGGGLALAVETLGWTCETWHGGDPVASDVDAIMADEALARLRAAVRDGPVLLGPVDFGFLSHFRGSSQMAGTDHYVVGLDLNERGLLLHDPAGLPYAVLPVEHLLPAWRADRIGFKLGPYTMRHRFRRVTTVTRSAMIERTLPVARRNTLANPGGPETFGGAEALVQLARQLRSEVTEGLERNLLGFSFPTAARRSVDAACFLTKGGHDEAAALVGQRATLWGRATSAAARREWGLAADTLDEMAEIERSLAGAL